MPVKAESGWPLDDAQISAIRLPLVDSDVPLVVDAAIRVAAADGAAGEDVAEQLLEVIGGGSPTTADAVWQYLNDIRAIPLLSRQ